MKSLLKRFLSKQGKVLISKDLYEQMQSKKSYNKYIEDQKYLEHSEYKYILWLDRIYQKINRVPGHIVELGVAYGRNAIIFGHQIKMNGDELVRRYYGFDTFKGYTNESLQQDLHLSKSAWTDNSMEWVIDKLKRTKVDDVSTLLEGDINTEVPKFLGNNPNFRCALLYVDCNAYSPSINGMEHFLPYMSPGGIICIDEKKQGGETKALIEFCQKHGYTFQKDASPFGIPAYTVI